MFFLDSSFIAFFACFFFVCLLLLLLLLLLGVRELQQMQMRTEGMTSSRSDFHPLSETSENVHFPDLV